MAISPESKAINLPGVANARQLGGYIGAGNRPVRADVLLRTGSLCRIPKESICLLTKKYRVCDIIDFRMDSEASVMPDPKIPGATNHHLSVLNDLPFPNEAMMEFSRILSIPEPCERYCRLYESFAADINMKETYHLIAFSKSGRKGYREYFRILLNKPPDRSILFHCTQGKDRTGIAAMLILSALGVDRETIMQDYLLTNEFRKESIDQIKDAIAAGTNDPAVMDFAEFFESVHQSFLDHVFHVMDENYGGSLGYIRDEMGVDAEGIRTLQKLYLE